MNIAKHLPTLARWFARKPKQLPDLFAKIDTPCDCEPPRCDEARCMANQSGLFKLIDTARHPNAPASETPAKAKETPLSEQLYWPSTKLKTPRKRVPYIPTNESPWGIISYEQGKWRVALYYVWATREAAREEARKYSKSFNVRTRVVRLIVPTR